MSNPYRINWIAPSTNYLAALQVPIANIPLIWNNNIVINNVSYQITLPNPNNYTGQILYPWAILPPDNVRIITLTSSGDLSGINFTISAIAENGASISQTIAGPNANTVSFTTPAWKIYSIIPSASSATTVSVGIGGGGYTMPFQSDVWNKQSLLSFEISKVVGTVSIIPQMTNDKDVDTITSFSVPYTQTWFNLPPDQTSVTIPITANTMFSFREFPVFATRMAVGQVTTTGTFTLTTIQQGGKY